jgi:hypothetical protein
MRNKPYCQEKGKKKKMPTFPKKNDESILTNSSVEGNTKIC